MVDRSFDDYMKIETFLAAIEAFVDRWGWLIVGGLENSGQAPA